MNREVPDLSIAPGQGFTFTLPRDTFVSREAGQVTYKATLVRAEGRTEQALPNWVHFDPVTGTFSGTPPSDSPEALHIKVIARDSQGNEASVTMTIETSGNTQKGKGKPDIPQSKFVGEASVFAFDTAESMELAVPMDRQADSPQRLGKGDAKPAGRASLSEQIRQANRHRAGLERMTTSRQMS